MARFGLTLAAALTTGAVCCAAPIPATAATCPHANLIPRPGNLHRMRAAVLCLVNRERIRHGERRLRFNRRIERAAQGHSREMAFAGYFGHVGPHGGTPLQRMRAAGYPRGRGAGFTVGENIAWGTLGLATPRAIVAAWMASPEHRANILDPRFTDTAIGISVHLPASLAHGQQGALYTQDFGAIVKNGASRYNLRPSRGWRRRSQAAEPGPSTIQVKTTRRHRGHGSTRRKVRHRHRLGTRHRPRHR